MKSVLTMKYPSSWHGEMWREAAPCGSGMVGALVYGGVDREYILLNHAHLWRGGVICDLPDVHESLEEVRRLLDEERPDLADSVLTNALRGSGYHPYLTEPHPLCDIRMERISEKPVYGYRRMIDLTKAEITVRWEEDGAVFMRSTFVSRADHLCYTKISCTVPGRITLKTWLEAHDRETMPQNSNAVKNPETCIRDGDICYSADNETVYAPADGSYGAVMRVISRGGVRRDDAWQITLDGADEVVLITGVFVGTDRETGFAETTAAVRNAGSYDEALAVHTALHRKLYEGVDFTISGTDTSVEEMLLEAYGSGASNELMESMYAYGRYLFVCSTGEPVDGAGRGANQMLPTHLVGLWNGTYQCFWAIHMFNVNFEMIYWQALSGNQPELLRTALDYVESMMDDFRENARKIFGCRGIYLDSVNTPETGKAECLAHHIINWTAGAAWVSQHFYDYFRYTGDTDYLREHALPFMSEAALFYEDFLRVRENGRYEFSPSTSPENVPSNVSEILHSSAQTSKNASMDIASVRELLTNLLEGAEITGLYPEKRAKWEEMLSLLPEYRYNEDGSLKEWADDFYKDQNSHRHHSHMYGVFPGHSVTADSPEYEAFRLAEQHRLNGGLKAQSSWSAVYMAGVNARFGDSKTAWFALSEMVRNCCMGNLFTVHNDWRRTGSVSCDDFRAAPFQIDANIGFPAVVNEMLVQSADGDIRLFPALPEQWKTGHLTGILTVGGHIVSVRWTESEAEAEITGGYTGSVVLRCGSDRMFADGSSCMKISLGQGEKRVVRICLKSL